MTHQPNCHYESWKEAYDAFYTAYPKACKDCDASGSVSWYEAVDEYGGMPMNEYCENCLGQGICPQCAEPIRWNEEDDSPYPCDACGWSEDDGAAPPYPECECTCEFDDKERFDLAVMDAVSKVGALDWENIEGTPEDIERIKGVLKKYDETCSFLLFEMPDCAEDEE